MTNRFRRSRYSRPKARAATPAQIAASERAWAEAHGSIHGRFAKGLHVLDHSGQCYVTTRPGRRYHEDSSSLLYPVKACRTPPAAAATERLREIIRDVLRTGVHEPGSRGGWSAQPDGGVKMDQFESPTGSELARWQDAKPGSLASYPHLEVREGGWLRAVQPNYDDSPSMAWLQSPRLAKEAQKLIAKAPRPVHLDRVHVTLRGAAAAAKAIGDGLRAFCVALTES